MQVVHGAPPNNSPVVIRNMKQRKFLSRQAMQAGTNSSPKLITWVHFVAATGTAHSTVIIIRAMLQ